MGQADSSTWVKPSSDTASLAEAVMAVMRSVGGVGYAINHDGFAGLHRSAGDEDGGNVQAQRCIEHARGDFIAVGDAYEGVGSVGIGHVLDGIGDDFA